MKFKVGDVCEIFKVETEPRALGRECTVIGVDPSNGKWAYQIHVPGLIGNMGHDIWWCPEYCLRLKRPPTEDDAEPRLDFTPCPWDRCAWQPKRENA